MPTNIAHMRTCEVGATLALLGANPCNYEQYVYRPSKSVQLRSIGLEVLSMGKQTISSSTNSASSITVCSLCFLVIKS
jgi:hypothetical protein